MYIWYKNILECDCLFFMYTKEYDNASLDQTIKRVRAVYEYV